MICVEQHDRGDIVAIRLGDACDLLGQDPHAYPVVPRGEAEIYQLARAPLHILGRGAVVQHEQGVGPGKGVAGHSQLGLDLMLQAGDDKDVRVAVNEALVRLIFNEGRAEEHDVVKLAPERPAQLVEKILRFTGVGGPHDQGIERQLSGVHGHAVAVAVYYYVVLVYVVLVYVVPARVLAERAPWPEVFVFPRTVLFLGFWEGRA